MITHEQLIRELGHPEVCDGKLPPAVEGVLDAILFLREKGAPLTPVQIETLLFSSIVTHRDDADVWGQELTAEMFHGVIEDNSFVIIKALIERLEKEHQKEKT